MKFKVLSILGLVVIGILLFLLTSNLIVTGVVTGIIAIIYYVILSVRRSHNRLALLDDACDPQAFIDMTKRHMEIAKNKANVAAFMEVDIAAGYINLGEFEEAEKILMEIDHRLLSEKNGVKLIYSINYVYTLYGLEKFEEAEEVYERDIAPRSPQNSYLKRSLKLLSAERAIYMGDLSQAKETLKSLVAEETSKREYLTILYLMAIIEVGESNFDQALEHYNKVSQDGNKLWIGQKSQNYIDERS